MKRATYILIVLLLSILLTGCQCKHEWQDATCETPKTCVKCGETEGEALGHTWVEPTCTEAEHCEVCGKIQGRALGHDWTEATCTTAAKCRRCGVMGTEAFGHTPGSLEAGKLDAVAARRVYTRKCSVCGSLLEEEERSVDYLHDYHRFLFTPAEFAQRITNLIAVNRIPYAVGMTDPKRPEEPYECLLIKDGERIATIIFFEELELLMSSQQTEPIISDVVVILETQGNDELAYAFKLALCACDPMFTTAEDLENGLLSILRTSEKRTYCQINGINYIVKSPDHTRLALYAGCSSK